MDELMVTPADRPVQPANPTTNHRPAPHALIAGLVALIVFAGYAAVAIGGIAGSPGHLLPLALLSGAGLVLWAAGRTARTQPGAHWTPLAAGLILLVAAASLTELAAHLNLSPSTLIRPLLMMGAALCWLVALLRIYRRQEVKLTISRLLDAVLVLVAGVTLAGQSVLAALEHARPEAIFSWGQAGVGVILFAALVVLRFTLKEPLPTADAVALGGVLGALVSEWGLQSSLQTTGVGPEPGLDTLRVGVGLLFGLAGYRAFTAPAARRAARWDRIAHWLPLAGLTGVSGLLVWHFNGSPLPDAVFGAALVSLSLAVLRLGVALGENQQLRQEQTQLRSQNEEYIRLAISDPLTGLFNKGYFTYRLHEEFARSERYRHPLTLIALDLDNFKQVNDRYGHAAGDTVLVAIADALRRSSRMVDVPCRCGGDEFFLILPQTPLNQGMEVAERLLAAANDVLRQRGLSPGTSISGGVAGYHHGMAGADELAHRADQALYAAKYAGKNRCARWTPEMARLLDAWHAPGQWWPPTQY
jgi:diguanylate cyclase (GGDEF)-like protein